MACARLILLVGTPGTGKRPIGSYLRGERGFVHLDLGNRAAREWLLGGTDAELRGNLAALTRRSEGVILTWAAGPTGQLRQIRRLGAAGVTLAWSDSDRGAALSAHYAERRPLPRFRFVDTFDRDGRFRPVEAVVADLLATAPRRRRLRMPAPSPQLLDDLRYRAGAAAAALAGAAAVAAVVLVGVSGGVSHPHAGASGGLAAALAQPAPGLPRKGVLVSGRSLAGVSLGDTTEQVRATWGGRYTRCSSCKPAMWFYLYPPPSDPVGAGVQFAGGRVVAVFTLGSPTGWRTDSGIRVGQILDNPTSGPRWKLCAGYSAKPTQVSKAAVTSILTQGSAVYGFALTRPSVSPCH
jgi:hypothetical protein